jgi:hypothetical protein
LALATIADTSPPSVSFRIQIHMPLPAITEFTATRGAGAGVGGSCESGTSVPGWDGGGQFVHGGGGGGGGQPAIGTGPVGRATGAVVVGGAAGVVGGVVAGVGAVLAVPAPSPPDPGDPAATGVAERGGLDGLRPAATTPPMSTSAATTASQRAGVSRRWRSWSYSRSTSSHPHGSPPRVSLRLPPLAAVAGRDGGARRAPPRSMGAALPGV